MIQTLCLRSLRYVGCMLALLFCLVHMQAWAQAITPSSTTAGIVTQSATWPEGMVWQTLAIDDNGTLRYWYYEGNNKPIGLLPSRGTSDAALWAFVPVRAGSQQYRIYNRAAGTQTAFVAPSISNVSSVSVVSGGEKPKIITLDEFRRSVPLPRILWNIVTHGGNYVESAQIGDNSHSLRLASVYRSETNQYQLHYYIAGTDTQHSNIIANIDLNDGHAYYDSIMKVLVPYLSAIKNAVEQPTDTLRTQWPPTAITQLTALYRAHQVQIGDIRAAEALLDFYLETHAMSKAIFTELKPLLPRFQHAIDNNNVDGKVGIVGSWSPDVLPELTALYNGYTNTPNFDEAKKLLDFYAQAITNGHYVALVSHKVYRFVNVYDQFGSYSLALNPENHMLRIAPTDSNDPLQHFVLIKKSDGYYIGSPYTGQFLAIPSRGGEVLLKMRSLNQFLIYDDRSWDEYANIGTLLPDSTDMRIHQIKIRNNFFNDKINYLRVSLDKNLGGHPIAFGTQFYGGSYETTYPDYRTAGWHIYPVGDLPLSHEAFSDLVRAANVVATAGQIYAPTIAAAKPLIDAYQAAIATIPPTPASLAALHIEASPSKIAAMPWRKPRANIAFHLMHHYREKSFGAPEILQINGNTNVEDLEAFTKLLEFTPYNSFVFELSADGESTYIWQPGYDAYACVKPDGTFTFTQNKAERTPFTMRPYYGDSTRVAYTIQAPNNQYVTLRYNGAARPFWNYKLTPTIETAFDSTSVWGYDTSTISVAHIDALGYTTFSSADTVAVPSALTPMKITRYNDANKTLTAVEVSNPTIPANTGVLLRGTPGLYLLEKSENPSPTADYADNLLRPVVKPTRLSHVYALSGVHTATFARTAANVLFPARRAYLPSSVVGTNASAIKFITDVATTIEGATTSEHQAKGVYYDLQGRRVLKPSKGVYILNGKTIVL